VENILCPIWGTHAVEEPSTFDGKQVRSDRAGGLYRITRSATATVQHLTPIEKARLTTWIVDQHRAGVGTPLVNGDHVDAAKTRRPLRHSERKRRFFEMLTHMGWRLSDAIKAGGHADDKLTSDRQRVAAWTELDESAEVGPFLALLAAEGLLSSGNNSFIYSLSPKGYEELERVQGGGTESVNAFVAMWFDPSMNEAYEKGIEPAIRRAGYDPIRIDKKEHNNKIDDEIIADIKRSRFIVADFTCSTVTDASGEAHALPRGGVYFEAGFAYGLGLPVVWVCREDHMGLVHFDTNHFAHILWQTPAELEERLYNRIVHVVGLGPGAAA
jgi:hypothetical protein